MTQFFYINIFTPEKAIKEKEYLTYSKVIELREQELNIETKMIYDLIINFIVVRKFNKRKKFYILVPDAISEEIVSKNIDTKYIISNNTIGKNVTDNLPEFCMPKENTDYDKR